MERGWAVSLELVRGDVPAADRARVDGLVVGPAPDGAIVVVDIPDIERAVGLAPADRLVVVDDGDRFVGHAALVVQPSLPAWSGAGSSDRVLAGFEVAPIARRWRDLRPASPVPARTTGALDVLVCFGGSDPAGVTERLAPAIAAGGAWRTTVVVGADHAPVDIPSATMVQAPPDLPARVLAADLVVIGAGTMKAEVACLGRPALLLAVVDDQLATGPAFAATGAARYLGDGRTIDPGAVVDAVATLISDASARTGLSETAWTTIDGRGADRIADAIVGIDPD